MRLLTVFVMLLMTVSVSAGPKKPARQPILWYRELPTWRDKGVSYLCLLRKGNAVRSRTVGLSVDEKGRKTAYYREGAGHVDENRIWVDMYLYRMTGSFFQKGQAAAYGAERLVLVDQEGSESRYRREAMPNLKGYRWEQIKTYDLMQGQ